MLTISQLADYAGVTVRAIRHYHQRGLLREPPRDASGYRRYDAQAVIDLTRIKTLAESGVPLGQIPRLLEAPEEELDKAIAELDVALAKRVDELNATRARLKALRTGNRFCLPDAVVDHLDRLQAIGLNDAQVTLERDVWILLVVLYPDQISRWLARISKLLDDPDVAQLYVDIHAARDWPPDDPRLKLIARRAAKLVRRHDRHAEAARDMRQDLRALHLVDEFGHDVSPAWQRMGQLAAAELEPPSRVDGA
ncbi:MerR family transcriptional regulator [Amycolatopsis acidiphila]|uniref:MerR family transcriptional regulator n=1 Tax=Amycolatopsis acidiphila TaxID=715473 RepID=UPI001643CB14|nr:MerR family transcriptional regulator [Amycolatopsis acidiphila]UIJ62045.1 MerR family transcriptional regulator [Amycolatopsis acidiphila]GHG98978.1 MerR family transcriptional regulator [Amycolatopsis acidiphila]